MNAGRVVAGAVLGLACASTVQADGYLPAAPYNYLHPPSGTRKNHSPTSGHVVQSMRHGRTTVELVLFTKDGQAGIDVRAGQIGASSPASRIVVDLQPVTPPKGLPSVDLVDGNAYRFSAQGTPGGRAVTLRAPMIVILRWPRTPTAVMQYTGGGWRSLCSFGHWTLSISTVACQARSFGTFAAVRVATKSRS